METNTSLEGYNNSFKIPLPNSTSVLVLGILSITFCWCLGIPGLALGIIALVQANNANKLYLENSGKYTEASYKNMEAGKICAIVGTSISGLFVLSFLAKVSLIGDLVSGLKSYFP